MKFKNQDKIRHLLKTISWRIVGTIDTMIVSYAVTGSIKIGMAIGGFEVFTKMILYYFHERIWFKYVRFGRDINAKHKNKHVQNLEKNLVPNLNILEQKYELNLDTRILKNAHQPMVIWMTGLSGSGKSTLANALQSELFKTNKQVYVLDGDNIRSGLNKDLDFSEAGRTENIRRISEVAKIFTQAGFIVITAFISPFEKDRQNAKDIVGTYFREVYIKASIETCEARDVKGLYQKARNGEINNFTGINSPFEEPKNPDLTIDTTNDSIEDSLKLLLTLIK